MKKFRIKWFNHKTEILTGKNIIDALIRGGYYEHDIHEIRDFKEVKENE